MILMRSGTGDVLEFIFIQTAELANIQNKTYENLCITRLNNFKLTVLFKLWKDLTQWCIFLTEDIESSCLKSDIKSGNDILMCTQMQSIVKFSVKISYRNIWLRQCFEDNLGI